MGAERSGCQGLSVDVERTTGFLVADARGRPVGHVECPLYGTAPKVPDALAVRSGHVIHRHYIVPAAAIGEIDDRSRVVELTLRRNELQRFL